MHAESEWEREREREREGDVAHTTTASSPCTVQITCNLLLPLETWNVNFPRGAIYFTFLYRQHRQDSTNRKWINFLQKKKIQKPKRKNKHKIQIHTFLLFIVSLYFSINFFRCLVFGCFWARLCLLPNLRFIMFLYLRSSHPALLQIYQVSLKPFY